METPRLCPSCHQPLAPDAPQGLCPTCLLRAGFPTDAGPEAGAGATTAAAARAAFVPPTVEELAKLFPQFEIVALIGRGGMGAVYKARQPALDRWVALKILPAEATARAGFTERFNREARALARLNHPGIVAVYDFGEAGGMPYFVMEFVDGVNLRQLARQSRMDARAALQIVPAICDALQYAHDEGVVHRDIKPENILVDRKGRVKIADFGIARIVDDSAPGRDLTLDAQQIVGTPHYMAPEQLEQPQSVDHRADIFALGVVFYELLTGELPLGKFPPPSKKVQIDVRLDEIVLRALEKNPALRFQQASEVRTQVETVAGGGAAPVVASPPQPVSKWSLFAMGAGAGSVVVALILVVLMLKGLSVPELLLISSPLLVLAVSMSVLIVTKAKGARPSRAVGILLSIFGLLVTIATLTISLYVKGGRSPRSPASVAIENPSNTAPSAWPEYDQMESDRETLRLLIGSAEADLATEKARYDAGVSDPETLAALQEKLGLLKARLDGDRERFAEIKMNFAEKRAELLKARYEAGLTTQSERRRAQVESEIARRRWVREQVGARGAGGTPTSQIRQAQMENATREVEITGEVRFQGMLSFPPGRASLDLKEVITRCGGFTERADRSQIRLLHVENGKEVSSIVNDNELSKPGRDRVNVVPGDKIVVPAIVPAENEHGANSALAPIP